MEVTLIVLFTLALLILITRPITVVFHELGHAIPAIILTRQPVTIYIGSHGNPENSLHIKLWLLDIWLKYNPLKWRLGLTVPSATSISINTQIIYTLTGPLTSFLIGVIACKFAFSNDLHGFLKLIFSVFLGSSIFDMITNLTPNKKPILLYNGEVTYNDGYQLLQLFFYKKFPGEYAEAAKLYNAKKYGNAAVLFDRILKNGFKNETIFRLAISSYLQCKNYTSAQSLYDEFSLQASLNSDDYANGGLAYSHCNQYNKALELYDLSIKLNPYNKYALNNKGYTLLLLEKFQDAIALFDKSIEIDKTFAYSYNNRGLAKIKIGNEDEGLRDINYSFELDSNNPYYYRNLGIYHFDRGDYKKALELFEKAKELDSLTHMIDELITNARINK